MANGIAANIPAIAGAPKGVGAGPAVESEVAETEGGGDHAHEHQQLSHGEDADHQFKGRGQLDAENVQAHEHNVGTDGGVFRVQRRKLHVQVGADG